MALILVVDDEPTVRHLLRDALVPKGHGVLEAEDGLQALEILQHRPVDLAIVDMVVPRLGGLPLVRQMRLGGSKAKILAIAAYGELSLPEALKAGADAVMEKPFPLLELDNRVAGLLQKPNERQA